MARIEIARVEHPGVNSQGLNSPGVDSQGLNSQGLVSQAPPVTRTPAPIGTDTSDRTSRRESAPRSSTGPQEAAPVMKALVGSWDHRPYRLLAENTALRTRGADLEQALAALSQENEALRRTLEQIGEQMGDQELESLEVAVASA